MIIAALENTVHHISTRAGRVAHGLRLDRDREAPLLIKERSSRA
jgi:hypothetical protein